MRLNTTQNKKGDDIICHTLIPEAFIAIISLSLPILLKDKNAAVNTLMGKANINEKGIPLKKKLTIREAATPLEKKSITLKIVTMLIKKMKTQRASKKVSKNEVKI